MAHSNNCIVTDVPMFAPMTMKIPDFTVTDPAPTRDMIMDVVDDEDWTRMVQRIPTISPATGFVSPPNKAPTVHPPMTLAAVSRRARPTRKKYRKKHTIEIPRKMNVHS
jgi:hypothetical protein